MNFHLQKLDRMTAAARAGLARACDPGVMAQLTDEIQAGLFELFEINQGESYLVTQFSRGDLYVECYQGKSLADFAPVFIYAAQQSGAHKIRFFTERPGLPRLLRKFGFVSDGDEWVRAVH